MAHDVFISHAHKDKGIADAICEKLESARVKCWIAERDITAGDDWTEATRNAIASSHAMVLVLSENANAAAHIEREIAHAFYTGRQIIPLRMSNALPKRDFLFYLGSVCWLDAFSMPAERQMEALTESIHGIVRSPNATRDSMLLPSEKQPTAIRDFSDSWIGALNASHYRTLGILKRVAVAASLLAVGWLLWCAFEQTKQEIPPGTRLATFTEPAAAPVGVSPTNAEAPDSKPTYVYSRFGLWEEPNPTSTPSSQRAPLENPPLPSVEQSASAAPSPLPDANQSESAAAESLGVRDGASERSGGGDHTRIASRQDVHGKKTRSKRRTRKAPESDLAIIRHIKSGLKTVWRQIVVRAKDIGD